MRTLLNRQEQAKALAITLGLSLLLHYFLSVSDFLFAKLLAPWIGSVPYFRLLFFPWLALLLYLSLKPRLQLKMPSLKFLFLSSPAPVLVSFIYGSLSHWPGRSTQDAITYFWYWLCIPLGEELLFRGWAFEFFERLYPNRKFTYLLSFSVSAWMTSLMFSLWHLQNLPQNPLPIVLFQVVYTFFTGLWLAEVRIRCGNPIPSAVAHSFLNIAASLP